MLTEFWTETERKGPHMHMWEDVTKIIVKDIRCEGD
jgi:hypothetical protein